MTTILIQEQAYLRLKDDLNAISPTLEFVLMRDYGSLSANGRPITIAEAQPEVAWLNVGLARVNLTQPYVRAVLESGTVNWMQTFNAGLDHAFYQDILKQGIRISGSSAQAIAIAEYVIANVLAHYQGVFERKEHQKAHHWQRMGFKELWRTCWLLVGFGNIGQELAKRLRAFEVEVIGVRRSGQAHPLADVIITQNELAEYLPKADVVVIACALNDETKGLANRKFFQRMKPGTTFVNIARGQIVDDQALIEALNEGIVSQAILDVFDPEPLPPDNPFWDMKNVILTPHLSNSGSNTPLRGDLLFLENLRRYLANEPLLNEAGKV